MNKRHCLFKAITAIITATVMTGFLSSSLSAQETGDAAAVTHYAVKFDTKASTARIPADTYYASVPRAVTFADGIGRINVAYPVSGDVKVQTYDPATGSYLSSVILDMPYERFGGITCDADGFFYLACGKAGSKDEITFCIVKYDPNGEKVAELSLTGEESCSYSGATWGTNTPFYAGSCDMAISNGILAVNFGRKMISGSQSNMVIYADTSDMHRVYGSTVYTSHSFDQRVYGTSSGSFIAINQGDASKRAFRITEVSKFQDNVGYFLPNDDDFCTYHFREGVSGTSGYFETFAQIGGLAELPDAYVFAASSERELSLAQAPASANGARDLFIQILKHDFHDHKNPEELADKYAVEGEVRTPTGEKPANPTTSLWLTGDEVNYGIIYITAYDEDHYAANPKVFAIKDDIFGLLWEKRTYGETGASADAEVWFSMMKTDGTVVREPVRVPGCMLAADTDPVVNSGYIWWASQDRYGSYLNELSPGNVHITRQPYATDITENEDGSYNIALAAEADNAEKCLWQQSADGINWTDLEEGFTYTAESVADNTFFRCVLTDALGFTVKSDVVTGLIKDAADTEAGPEGIAQLSVTGYGISSYEWQESPDGSTWNAISSSDITGKDSAILKIPMTTDQRFKNKYRCVVTGPSSVKIPGRAATVTKKLTVVTQPKSRGGKKGDILSTSVEGWGEDVSYQWYERSGFEDEWEKADFAGNDTATLSVTADDKTLNRQYKCVLTDKYGKTVDSNVIFLFIDKDNNVQFERKSITLVSKPGSTAIARVKITGTMYTEDSLVWTSSDPSTVSVDKGVLTAAEGIEEACQVRISFTTFDDYFSDECIVYVNPMPQVQTPLASVAAGSVVKGTRCLLTTRTERASILYTTDGTAPSVDENGQLLGTTQVYGDAITIDHAMTIRAIAVKDGYKASKEAAFEYTIRGDWGDVRGVKLREAVGGADKVPDEVWYIFGNETTGYTPVYTASDQTTYTRDHTGSAITLQSDIHVFYNTTVLWENRDYTVSYKNNKAVAAATEAKAPTFTIKGKGRYTKSSVFTFTIKGSGSPGGTGTIPASKVKVACLNNTELYTGSPVVYEDLYKPDNTGYLETTLYTVVNKQNVPLAEGDYDVLFSNNGCVGKHTLTFALKGNYTGNVTRTITVKPYDIGKDIREMMTITCSDASFAKAGAVPEVTVMFGDTVLKEGIDYRLKLSNNKNTGEKGTKSSPTVTITGTGNFTGKAVQTFSVAKADLGKLELTADDIVYKAKKGNFITVPKITDNGTQVTAGKNKDLEPVAKTDFRYYDADTGEELDASMTVAEGTLIEVRLTVTATGASPYTEGKQSINGFYRVIPANKDIKKASVKITDPAKITYKNGQAVILVKSEDLKVTMGKTVLDPSDYEIISVKNNIFPGTGTMILRGRGDYGGRKKVLFKIGAHKFI